MANSTLQEWLNRNSYRAYPFIENTNFSCINGKSLPNSVILDARFCIFGTKQALVLLKSIEITVDTIVASLILREVEIETETEPEAEPDIKETIITVTSVGSILSYSNSEGTLSLRIISNNKQNLKDCIGKYELNTPAQFLESRVMCIPFGIGVDTITADGTTATGIIKVANGTNSVLNIRRNNLVLNIGKGLGEGVKCQELEDVPVMTCDGSIIRFINGQQADSDGNIQIFGGDGIAVVSSTFQGVPAIIILPSSEVTGFAMR